MPSTLNTLATADDPRHPAEADTTPPIPDPPLGGNPARSSVEDAIAAAVPTYLATKHAAYAPAKWRLFYLYMRCHYVDECLARTPTRLADAVRHHSAVSRHVLFHLFRSQGAITQDEPVGVLDTHDAVEQHDADTDEKQRRDADASADRWSVATARVRNIDTVLRHCASALDGVAPDISQPQRVAAVRKLSQAPCELLSPTRPAVPSRSLLSQVMLFHCLQLGSGRQMATLFPNHLRPHTRPNGVRGLEACVTSGQRGQQRRPKRPLTCVTLATPATPPPTLTLPSSL